MFVEPEQKLCEEIKGNLASLVSGRGDANSTIDNLSKQLVGLMNILEEAEPGNSSDAAHHHRRTSAWLWDLLAAEPATGGGAAGTGTSSTTVAATASATAVEGTLLEYIWGRCDALCGADRTPVAAVSLDKAVELLATALQGPLGAGVTGPHARAAARTLRAAFETLRRLKKSKEAHACLRVLRALLQPRHGQHQHQQMWVPAPAAATDASQVESGEEGEEGDRPAAPSPAQPLLTAAEAGAEGLLLLCLEVAAARAAGGDTLKAEALQLAGTLCAAYPAELSGRASDVRGTFVAVAERLTREEAAPPTLLEGLLLGLRDALVVFPFDASDPTQLQQARLVQDVVRSALNLQGAGRQGRYACCRAALAFVNAHAETVMRDALAADAEGYYALLGELWTHPNKDVHRAAYGAVASFLESVSRSLCERPASVAAGFLPATLARLGDMLDATRSAPRQVALGIVTCGALARPLRLCAGAEELQAMFLSFAAAVGVLLADAGPAAHPDAAAASIARLAPHLLAAMASYVRELRALPPAGARALRDLVCATLHCFASENYFEVLRAATVPALLRLLAALRAHPREERACAAILCHATLESVCAPLTDAPASAADSDDDDEGGGAAAAAAAGGTADGDSASAGERPSWERTATAGGASPSAPPRPPPAAAPGVGRPRDAAKLEEALRVHAGLWRALLLARPAAGGGGGEGGSAVEETQLLLRVAMAHTMQQRLAALDLRVRFADAPEHAEAVAPHGAAADNDDAGAGAGATAAHQRHVTLHDIAGAAAAPDGSSAGAVAVEAAAGVAPENAVDYAWALHLTRLHTAIAPALWRCDLLLEPSPTQQQQREGEEGVAPLAASLSGVSSGDLLSAAGGGVSARLYKDSLRAWVDYLAAAAQRLAHVSAFLTLLHATVRGCCRPRPSVGLATSGAAAAVVRAALQAGGDPGGCAVSPALADLYRRCEQRLRICTGELLLQCATCVLVLHPLLGAADAGGLLHSGGGDGEEEEPALLVAIREVLEEGGGGGERAADAVRVLGSVLEQRPAEAHRWLLPLSRSARAAAAVGGLAGRYGAYVAAALEAADRRVGAGPDRGGDSGDVQIREETPRWESKDLAVWVTLGTDNVPLPLCELLRPLMRLCLEGTTAADASGGAAPAAVGVTMQAQATARELFHAVVCWMIGTAAAAVPADLKHLEPFWPETLATVVALAADDGAGGIFAALLRQTAHWMAVPGAGAAAAAARAGAVELEGALVEALCHRSAARRRAALGSLCAYLEECGGAPEMRPRVQSVSLQLLTRLLEDGVWSRLGAATALRRLLSRAGSRGARWLRAFAGEAAAWTRQLTVAALLLLLPAPSDASDGAARRARPGWEAVEEFGLLDEVLGALDEAASLPPAVRLSGGGGAEAPLSMLAIRLSAALCVTGARPARAAELLRLAARVQAEEEEEQEQTQVPVAGVQGLFHRCSADGLREARTDLTDMPGAVSPELARLALLLWWERAGALYTGGAAASMSPPGALHDVAARVAAEGHAEMVRLAQQPGGERRARRAQLLSICEAMAGTVAGNDSGDAPRPLPYAAGVLSSEGFAHCLADLVSELEPGEDLLRCRRLLRAVAAAATGEAASYLVGALRAVVPPHLVQACAADGAEAQAAVVAALLEAPASAARQLSALADAALVQGGRLWRQAMSSSPPSSSSAALVVVARRLRDALLTALCSPETARGGRTAAEACASLIVLMVCLDDGSESAEARASASIAGLVSAVLRSSGGAEAGGGHATAASLPSAHFAEEAAALAMDVLLASRDAGARVPLSRLLEDCCAALAAADGEAGGENEEEDAGTAAEAAEREALSRLLLALLDKLQRAAAPADAGAPSPPSPVGAAHLERLLRGAPDSCGEAALLLRLEAAARVLSLRGPRVEGLADAALPLACRLARRACAAEAWGGRKGTLLGNPGVTALFVGGMSVLEAAFGWLRAGPAGDEESRGAAAAAAAAGGAAAEAVGTALAHEFPLSLEEVAAGSAEAHGLARCVRAIVGLLAAAVPLRPGLLLDALPLLAYTDLDDGEWVAGVVADALRALSAAQLEELCEACLAAQAGALPLFLWQAATYRVLLPAMRALPAEAQTRFFTARVAAWVTEAERAATAATATHRPINALVMLEHMYRTARSDTLKGPVNAAFVKHQQQQQQQAAAAAPPMSGKELTVKVIQVCREVRDRPVPAAASGGGGNGGASAAEAAAVLAQAAFRCLAAVLTATQDNEKLFVRLLLDAGAADKWNRLAAEGALAVPLPVRTNFPRVSERVALSSSDWELRGRAAAAAAGAASTAATATIAPRVGVVSGSLRASQNAASAFAGDFTVPGPTFGASLAPPTRPARTSAAAATTTLVELDGIWRSTCTGALLALTDFMIARFGGAAGAAAPGWVQEVLAVLRAEDVGLAVRLALARAVQLRAGYFGRFADALAGPLLSLATRAELGPELHYLARDVAYLLLAWERNNTFPSMPPAAAGALLRYLLETTARGHADAYVVRCNIDLFREAASRLTVPGAIRAADWAPLLADASRAEPSPHAPAAAPATGPAAPPTTAMIAVQMLGVLEDLGCPLARLGPAADAEAAYRALARLVSGELRADREAGAAAAEVLALEHKNLSTEAGQEAQLRGALQTLASDAVRRLWAAGGSARDDDTAALRALRAMEAHGLGAGAAVDLLHNFRQRPAAQQVAVLETVAAGPGGGTPAQAAGRLWALHDQFGGALGEYTPPVRAALYALLLLLAERLPPDPALGGEGNVAAAAAAAGGRDVLVCVAEQFLSEAARAALAGSEDGRLAWARLAAAVLQRRPRLEEELLPRLVAAGLGDACVAVQDVVVAHLDARCDPSLAARAELLARRLPVSTLGAHWLRHAPVLLLGAARRAPKFEDPLLKPLGDGGSSYSHTPADDASVLPRRAGGVSVGGGGGLSVQPLFSLSLTGGGGGWGSSTAAAAGAAAATGTLQTSAGASQRTSASLASSARAAAAPPTYRARRRELPNTLLAPTAIAGDLCAPASAALSGELPGTFSAALAAGAAAAAAHRTGLSSLTFNRASEVAGGARDTISRRLRERPPREELLRHMTGGVRDRRRRAEERARARAAAAAGRVAVFRAYTDGAVPDVAVSLRSLVVPLQALCLHCAPFAARVCGVVARWIVGLEGARPAARELLRQMCDGAPAPPAPPLEAFRREYALQYRRADAAADTAAGVALALAEGAGAGLALTSASADAAAVSASAASLAAGGALQLVDECLCPWEAGGGDTDRRLRRAYHDVLEPFCPHDATAPSVAGRLVDAATARALSGAAALARDGAYDECADTLAAALARLPAEPSDARDLLLARRRVASAALLRWEEVAVSVTAPAALADVVRYQLPAAAARAPDTLCEVVRAAGLDVGGGAPAVVAAAWAVGLLAAGRAEAAREYAGAALARAAYAAADDAGAHRAAHLLWLTGEAAGAMQRSADDDVLAARVGRLARRGPWPSRCGAPPSALQASLGLFELAVDRALVDAASPARQRFADGEVGAWRDGARAALVDFYRARVGPLAWDAQAHAAVRALAEHAKQRAQADGGWQQLAPVLRPIALRSELCRRARAAARHSSAGNRSAAPLAVGSQGDVGAADAAHARLMVSVAQLEAHAPQRPSPAEVGEFASAMSADAAAAEALMDLLERLLPLLGGDGDAQADAADACWLLYGRLLLAALRADPEGGATATAAVAPTLRILHLVPWFQRQPRRPETTETAALRAGMTALGPRVWLPWSTRLLAALLETADPTLAQLTAACAQHDPQAMFPPLRCEEARLRAMDAPATSAETRGALQRARALALEAATLQPLKDFVKCLGALQNPARRARQLLLQCKGNTSLEQLSAAVLAAAGGPPIAGELHASFVAEVLPQLWARASSPGGGGMRRLAKLLEEEAGGLDKESVARHTRRLASLLRDNSLAGEAAVLLPRHAAMALAAGAGQDTREWLTGVEDQMLLLASLERPRRIGLHTNRRPGVRFLLKENDDLRADQRVEEIFMVVNTLVRRSPSAAARAVQTRTFSVVPLQADRGLVEWVPDTTTLGACIPAADSKAAKRAYEQCLKLTATGGLTPYLAAYTDADAPAQYRRMVTSVTGAHHLAAWLEGTAASLCAVFAARTRFLRSYGGLSACGYLLGVGDRHLGNTLLDQRSGEAISIDFGRVLGFATAHLPLPELLPMRLTPIITRVGGALGNEPLACHMAEVLRVARRRAAVLESLAGAFPVKQPTPGAERLVSDRLRQRRHPRRIALDELSANAGLAAETRRALVRNLRLDSPGSDCDDNDDNEEEDKEERNGGGEAAAAAAPRDQDRRTVDRVISLATDPELVCRAFAGLSLYF